VDLNHAGYMSILIGLVKVIEMIQNIPMNFSHIQEAKSNTRATSNI
jgi:hypothetical protein